MLIHVPYHAHGAISGLMIEDNFDNRMIFIVVVVAEYIYYIYMYIYITHQLCNCIKTNINIHIKANHIIKHKCTING